MYHPYYNHGSPQPRRRTSNKPRKERPDVDKIVDGVISQLKTKGLFDQFRKDCLSDVDTKPSYINLQSKVSGTVDTFLKGQAWSPSFPKLKMRDVMRKKIEEAPYFVKGLDSIVDQALGSKVDSIFRPIIEEEVFKFMGCEKEEYEEKERLKQLAAEERYQRPPSPPSPPPPDHGEERHFKMLGSDFFNMSSYANSTIGPSNHHFSPPPLPPMEPPPPPPADDEDDFDEQMDYTPVTPPYPPPPDPTDEPLPPGEDAVLDIDQSKINDIREEQHQQQLETEVSNGDIEEAPQLPPAPLNAHQSEESTNNTNPYVHMNGWAAHEPEVEDNTDLNPSSPKSECVEEDSEEESPMFEKIGEVSPPRPVLLENSDDILRELQEQARLNNGILRGEIKKDHSHENSPRNLKHFSDVFDCNSRDSGSSNLVICEDYTPPQEPSTKSGDKEGRKERRIEYSENSNSSSASSRNTPHKRSYSSSSNQRKESSSRKPYSKDSKSCSSSSSTRHEGRSSSRSQGSRDRDRGQSSSSSKERDVEKRNSSSKSSHSSGSHKHSSSSSSSHKRSSSSHSDHNTSTSTSTSHRHSSSNSSSHRHSSKRSSSSSKCDRRTGSSRPEKDVKGSGGASSVSSESFSNKEMEGVESPNLMMPSKLSDNPSDSLSPFKLPEQLRPFASICQSKSSERDETIIEPSGTFSALTEDESNLESHAPEPVIPLPEESNVCELSEPEVLSDETVPTPPCDNPPVSPLVNETVCSEDTDENCRYLEPIPVFEEKLSYYRKLPEFQIH